MVSSCPQQSPAVRVQGTMLPAQPAALSRVQMRLLAARTRTIRLGPAGEGLRLETCRETCRAATRECLLMLLCLLTASTSLSAMAVSLLTAQLQRCTADCAASHCWRKAVPQPPCKPWLPRCRMYEVISNVPGEEEGAASFQQAMQAIHQGSLEDLPAFMEGDSHMFSRRPAAVFPVNRDRCAAGRATCV